MKNLIAFDKLKSLLSYDPLSGRFTWKLGLGLVGRLAGTRNRVRGILYRRIRIDWRYYSEHRLAWFYTTGEWPQQLDHVNGDGCDNRWSNLRIASASENAQNQSRHRSNSSGLIGVCWDAHNKRWKAQIEARGVQKHLGLFSDKNEAHRAYCAAKAELHQFNPIPR